MSPTTLPSFRDHAVAQQDAREAPGIELQPARALSDAFAGLLKGYRLVLDLFGFSRAKVAR